jgi:hypothetical protein
MSAGVLDFKAKFIDLINDASLTIGGGSALGDSISRPLVADGRGSPHHAVSGRFSPRGQGQEAWHRCRADMPLLWGGRDLLVLAGAECGCGVGVCGAYQNRLVLLERISCFFFLTDWNTLRRRLLNRGERGTLGCGPDSGLGSFLSIERVAQAEGEPIGRRRALDSEVR